MSMSFLLNAKGESAKTSPEKFRNGAKNSSRIAAAKKYYLDRFGKIQSGGTGASAQLNISDKLFRACIAEQGK
jgi:hypothetical protein